MVPLMAQETQILAVDECNHKQRLDRFVVEALAGEFTRVRIQKAILEGAVQVNGQMQTSSSLKLKQGDEVLFTIPETQTLDVAPEDIPLEIMYEDSDVIVLNKTAGISVHPSNTEQSGTLVNGLLYHCKDLSGIGGVERPGIVHRLDKGTSGVMIVAKNDKAHQHLAKQFQNRTIERYYYAICYGVPTAAPRHIETYIGRHPKDRKKMTVVDSGGKHAITTYTLEKSYADVAALLKFKLHTGRTHQIRVHAQYLGYPLMGDPLYAGRLRQLPDAKLNACVRALNHQMLHAAVLGFEHPTTGEIMRFEAEISSDMQELIFLLEKQ